MRKLTFWEVDISGVDILGVDILGVDILRLTLLVGWVCQTPVTLMNFNTHIRNFELV